MAIYIRSRPTTGIKALGTLCTLATVGTAALYPIVLLLAAFALGALDEAMADSFGGDPHGEDPATQPVANLVTFTVLYSATLTALCVGAVSCFKGADTWLSKNASVPHRDIATARFLHVAQDPEKRLLGLLQAMLAGSLLAASPIILFTVPHTLIYSASTRDLVGTVTAIVVLLLIAIFILLVRAAARRRASAVRLSPRGMAVANMESFSLPLPSSRDDLRVQEAPARRGRVQVQAVYSPHGKGAKPGTPILIPRLSLTVAPSQLDDARRRVEARLDEVWRACELVRTPPEQDEVARPEAPSSSE
ncbi:hypothetical protein [Actinomyces viscosus]|uniref:hypothetical protein n=1 Tax=Actinomyces viscosus TaxID=1656 RepID=UPI0028EE5469|nr:hypothetical protein [Actinomyces viscosus]